MMRDSRTALSRVWAGTTGVLAGGDKRKPPTRSRRVLRFVLAVLFLAILVNASMAVDCQNRGGSYSMLGGCVGDAPVSDRQVFGAAGAPNRNYTGPVSPASKPVREVVQVSEVRQ
jgi:hypothetical protein